MSDLISRQAAIDGIMQFMPEEEADMSTTEQVNYSAWVSALSCVKTFVRTMPSAQPEIIRCTECKHYREYDSEYVENAVVVQCMADRYPISEIIPDGWFCAGAERKDDE